jgi:hypothetical protein
MTQKLETIYADWNDTEGLYKEFVEVLHKFGLYTFVPEQFKGSADYTVVISDQPITQETCDQEWPKRLLK